MSKICVELTGEYEFLEDNGKIYAEMTDFSFITILSNSSSKFGSYYASLENPNEIHYVSNLSGRIIKLTEKYNRSYGLRPVLNIEDIPQEVLDKGKKLNDETLVIEYGYFPQSRVNDFKKENEIKDKISNKTINETGKYYSMISMQDKVYCLPCYEDNGKFYVKIDTSKIDEEIKMPRYPRYYVIEVEPVKWLVDLKTGKVISENVLIANIPFSLTSSTDYETSYVKKYLEEMFLDELLQFEKIKVNKELVDKVMNADKEESVFEFIHNISNKNVASKARILTVNEVFKNPCEIIKKVGTKAAITDYSIATGGIVSNLKHVNGPSMDNRCGSYLLNSENADHISVVNSAGTEIWESLSGAVNTSQRIVLPFYDINIMEFEKSDSDFFELEYGYYPQMVVSQDLAQILTSLKNKDVLKKTGKKYRRYFAGKQLNFEEDVLPCVEYEYNGKRYISVFMLGDNELSDGVKHSMFKQVWIEVMPVKWYVSKKDDMMVSEKSLFAGVPYNANTFEDSYVNKFIKEIFMMDLLQDRNYKIIKEVKKESKKLDLTFLTEEQVFGDKKLDILKKYGTKASITDFSILLGGFVAYDEYSSEGNSLKDRTGGWWTKSPDENNDARIVTSDGLRSSDVVDERSGGVRPALPYSLISFISGSIVRGKSGIKKVEYGKFPQTIVSETLSNNLEEAYSNGNLKPTGKHYTTDSVHFHDYATVFNARVFPEYEVNGEEFIRFVADENCDGETLSDGRKVEAGKIYWVKVEPISWLVDEKENIALSKKIIFSGVQFNNKRNYNGEFDKTDIKRFMDNYFAKEITKVPNLNIGEKIDVQEVTKEDASNLGKELFEKINDKNYDDDIDEIIDLVKKGADVNYRIDNGMSPLLLCAIKNNYKTAALLLKAGADVNITDKNLCSPLMYSIMYHNFPMFDLLVDSCDLNLRDRNGYTALMYAKKAEASYMFDKLIQKGALINVLNNYNETIFDIESSIDDSSFRPKKKVEFEDAIELLNEAQDRLDNLLDEDSNESIHEKVLKLF